MNNYSVTIQPNIHPSKSPYPQVDFPTQNKPNWGHRLVSAIKSLPIVGLIPTLVDKLIKNCRALRPSPPSQPPTLKKAGSIGPKWLFVGTQQGKSGSVSKKVVDDLRIQLDIRHPPGIRFSPNKVVDCLEGGTCSSMTLEFLDSYFKEKADQSKLGDSSVEGMIKRIQNLSDKFLCSSEKRRDLQAAFNTIVVENIPGGTVDYSRNKVQSLANFHDLEIDYCSRELDLTTVKSEKDIADLISELPKGAFFIRIIQPANNDKLEVQGHSLAYIKEDGLEVYYDPNYGARNLSSLENAKAIFENFNQNLSRFQVSQARFYRLQPKAFSNILW